MKSKNTNESKNSLNFHKADYGKIIKDLNAISWIDEFSGYNDINSMVTKFYKVLRRIISKHVPIKKHNNKTYPVWFSPQLIKLLKTKLKYHAKVKKI